MLQSILKPCQIRKGLNCCENLMNPRSHGGDIQQVNANMLEKQRSVLIANSEGLLVEDSVITRMRLSAIAEKGDGPQTAAESPGVLGGYEFFREIDVEKISNDAVNPHCAWQMLVTSREG